MSSERRSAAPRHVPDFLEAFEDDEWTYYVRGHDEDELWVVDDPRDLVFEKLWLREASGDDALRETDGESDHCWVACHENAKDAEAWMGVRYAPA